MSQKIIEALAKLDVSNDNHWTADGLPRLDTLKMLASDQSLTRDAVSAAQPGFTRTSASGTAAPAPAAPVTSDPAPIATPVAPQAVAAATSAVEDPDNAPDDADVGTKAPEPVVTAEVTTQDEPEFGVHERLAVEKALMRELAAVKADADKAYAAQVRKVDALIVEAEKTKANDSNQDAIQRYLAQQVANGQERARRIEALKGIDLKTILPTKAPIDLVRRRQTGYGHKR